MGRLSIKGFYKLIANQIALARSHQLFRLPRGDFIIIVITTTHHALAVSPFVTEAVY